METLVARIGKPHGLRGEVTVQTHTDSPQERFVPGTVFETDPQRGPLTLRSARRHQGVWLLGFDEAGDRTAAEALRDTRLMLDVPLGGSGNGTEGDDEDGWYPEELAGIAVRNGAGEVIGEVTELVTRPAQDLLEVRLLDGRTGLVPFVEALVPTVQAGAGVADPHVVIDAPDGLFDL